MKIHYKTIELGTDGGMQLLSKQIIEHHHKYLIEYCCDTMMRAVRAQALDITQNELSIQVEEHDEGGSIITGYYPPINYCPFCGEVIEQVEDYRAKLERHSVHVPSKTVPAHNEIRNKEVRI